MQISLFAVQWALSEFGKIGDSGACHAQIKMVKAIGAVEMYSEEDVLPDKFHGP